MRLTRRTSFSRSRAASGPTPTSKKGHRSLLLVHYANISCRLGGRKLRIDPQTERILDDPEAMRFFQREYRQPWVVEEVV